MAISFLDSGSILTMADHKTYFVETSKKNLSGDLQGYILSPRFSLKELKNSVQIHNLKDNIVLGPNNSTLESLKNADWIADIQDYKVKYENISAAILSKEIKKAVPFLTYRLKKPNDFNQTYLKEMIRYLKENKPESEFIYGSWNQTEGFIGCTPEFLIQRKPYNLKIETMALAGTLPAVDNTNMLKDIKLSEEHKFVMDDISEKLIGYKINWSQPKEKIYDMVKHIHSLAEFDSKTNGLDSKLNFNLSAIHLVEDLILKLSPTSALGVYPKEKLKNFENILCLESRGAYGAPFGFVLKNQFNIIVGLRGLFWDDEYLNIHVGGGVTDKSDYQSELSELNLKFLSTKKKLGF